jgi:hypothetical protein
MRTDTRMESLCCRARQLVCRRATGPGNVMRIASEGVCLLCPLRCVVTSEEVTHHKWAAIR